MENESVLKRLGWSAAAATVAAAIWLASPLREFFFFPRHMTDLDKAKITIPFLVSMAALLFLFGKYAREMKLTIVVLAASGAGVVISAAILIIWSICLSYSSNNWGRFSSVENIYQMLVVIAWVSFIRGTFAFAAFIAVVYRYLPKALGLLFRSKPES